MQQVPLGQNTDPPQHSEDDWQELPMLLQEAPHTPELHVRLPQHSPESAWLLLKQISPDNLQQ
jgi:hypothetical protein